ncbi:MAG TPA: GNAT family N-acetyltransferase [Patescibacteria group bacterium]
MAGRKGKTPIVSTRIYNPKTLAWAKIRNNILEIEAKAFPQYDPQEKVLATDFTNHNNLVILLRNLKGRVIGYAYAEPIGQISPKRKQEKDTAYVTSVAIHPRFQGKGLVSNIHRSLERNLKRRGFAFFEGDVINEGYIKTLTRVYADRIVRKRRSNNKKDGATSFIRVRLD